MKRILPLLWLLLIATTINLFACAKPTPGSTSVSTEDSRPVTSTEPALILEAIDLMASYHGASVTARGADNAFVANQLRLAVDFLKAVCAEKEGENVLLSPLSIQLALAMTANGADGATREEMQAVLGGTLPLATLNEYLYTYVSSLGSGDKYKVNVANSIWFRDTESFTVERDFLQVNADYYSAAAYKAPFDASTLKDINAWIANKTDGLITEALPSIDPSAVMYLINTVLFDAEWSMPYEENEIRDGAFTSLDGTSQTVDMMHGEEYRYLLSENASGFLKDYEGGKYSFAAILPKEGMTISEYIAEHLADELGPMLANVRRESVRTVMPKFTTDFDVEMKDVLSSFGMKKVFDSAEADLSKTGHSIDGNLYVSSVFHKTHITVDARGTKAGAVTIVTDNVTSVPMPPQNEVILDRPFLYLILDNETNLPLFCGVLTSLS